MIDIDTTKPAKTREYIRHMKRMSAHQAKDGTEGCAYGELINIELHHYRKYLKRYARMLNKQLYSHGYYIRYRDDDYTDHGGPQFELWKFEGRRLTERLDYCEADSLDAFQGMLETIGVNADLSEI